MRNEYGLDVDYFTKLCTREFSPESISRQTPSCLARSLARAARTACPGVLAEHEFQWERLSRPGQIKAGDQLQFQVDNSKITAIVREVLNPGTTQEEVIYNRKRNHYFITAMALNGTSSHKQVFVRIRESSAS